MLTVRLDRALCRAAEKGDLARVKALIARGADVNAAQENGWTALMLASGRNRVAVVRFLLSTGASVDRRSVLYNDTSALRVAASAGHAAICRLLLTKGADVNERDVSGNTVLMDVIGNGNLTSTQVLRMVEILVSRGADVNARSTQGETALALARSRPAALGRLTSVVQLLRRVGAKG